MDRDYFQYVEESSSSALRIASRTIAMAAYGMIGVYMLSVAITGTLPTVVLDILPRLINEDSSMDIIMMANGSHEYEMIAHGEI